MKRGALSLRGPRGFFRLLLPAGCFFAALFCGCASMERMKRMSGGIINEYAPPDSYRIRSEKYRKIRRNLASPNRAKPSRPGGIDESLVNVWPFYFRSGDYLSVLWPMMDFDAYGMAVRPFYNHEGDDYSILFPLSAWNPQDGMGWALLWAWDREGSGLLPFSWRYETPGESFCYFLNYSRLLNKRKFDSFWRVGTPSVMQRSRTFFLPWYCTVYEEKDWGEWGKIREAVEKERGSYPRLKKILPVLFAGTGEKAPKSQRELDFWMDNRWWGLPVRDEYAFGLFPLFDIGRDGRSWRCFASLAGCETGPGSLHWDVLGKVMASYRGQDLPPVVRKFDASATSTFTSWALLSHFSKRQVYAGKGVDLLRKLHEPLASAGGPDNGAFQKKLGDVRKLLEQYPGAPPLPDWVTDAAALSFFLRMLPEPPDVKVKTAARSGFMLPLFYYDIGSPSPNSSSWSLPAFLTWGGSSPVREKFISVPLVSYREKTPEREFLTIASPLCWVSKSRFSSRIGCTIYPRSELWGDSAASRRNDYALCGLYYRGENTFYVAKPGVDAAVAERVRQDIYTLHRLIDRQKNLDSEFARDMKRAAGWRPAPGDKIDYYRKMIFLEEMKGSKADLEKKRTELESLAGRLAENARKIGFAFHRERIENPATMGRELERLFDQCAELRSRKDSGSAFFFHKENFHNGDYHWDFLSFLAGGSREKGRESTQILHFLYRHSKQGRHEETLYFPFVSIQKDGEDSQVSFLGRVFQRTVKNGKSSGYFLFIPW